MGLPSRMPPCCWNSATGGVVKVGSHSFEVQRSLGAGSFGAVWAAQAIEDGREAAVKEILCRTEGELRRVAAERQLLQHLTSSAGGQSQLPSLLASEAEAAGGGAWRVRLAMTRVPGVPLANAMRARRELAKLRCSEEPLQRFLAACSFSTELLRQLSPAMKTISTVAFHRDVTPRNILVEDTGGTPRFGLVDFGLAVDARRWQSDDTVHDIGGDGLYWTSSAWFAFAHGSKELSLHPALDREYKMCLDLHSLGLSALGCLVDHLEAGSSSPRSDGAGLGAAASKLRALKAAWSRYWSNAKRFWQPVYDAFRAGSRTECETLKAAYAQAGVHKVVASDLRGLRSALRAVRTACAKEEALEATLPLFDALMLLVSTGEDNEEIAEWSDVHEILGAQQAPDFDGNAGRQHKGYITSCAHSCMQEVVKTRPTPVRAA